MVLLRTILNRAILMDEVELADRGGEDEIEMIQVSPVRRLENRIRQLEQTTAYAGLPQLQGLITQIIELVKSNQKIVDEVIKANSDLRNELAKMPPKLDELIIQMKTFMNLVRMAGEESEVSISPEMMNPVTEQLQKLTEQNQKVLDSNEEVMSSLEEINKKIKSGTPVSQLLASYPKINIRGLQKQ